ncbi:MAG: hypothetical protein N3C63_10745 [Rhodocyclaceae bacterium]|nr:hypothetical protein [Rhodocyclaceae bacterium]
MFQATAAFAVGLGSVKGEAIIGAPLSLAIEVIEPERLSLECFEYQPIAAGDERFFLRRARLTALKREGGRTWLMLQGEEVREPIVEFRITALCGAQVSREYILLASPGRELQPELPAAATVKAAVSNGAKPAARPLEPGTRPISGVTLEALARQRYPLQPKAREKFKRMMREANADWLGSLADDEALPVAPERLVYPADLPKRRVGPYVPPLPPAKQAAPATPPDAAPKPAPAATPAKTKEIPAQDKLVIGAGGGSEKAPTPAEAAVAAQAEASFAAQEELLARLAQAENTYQALKAQFESIEQRLASLEAEKARLKREAEKQAERAMLELAAAILLGGLCGALLMSLWRRRAAAGPARL